MRYSYGGSIADWVFRPAATSEVGDLAQVLGGVEVAFWSARDGGLQYTDLLSGELMPISSVFTESAGDVGAVGQIPPFFGPEGVSVMWASADGGPRALIRTNDLPVHVHDAADIVTGVIDPSRLPAGVGGIGDPGTLWVAAVDAPVEFDAAQYVCDGVDDQVQIQAALDAAGGKGVVRLSPGTFQLSAPVRIVGTTDVGFWAEGTLIGYGTTVTILKAASGVSSAIELCWSVTPHLADFGLEVESATHGISTAVKDTVAPEVNGGTLTNIMVQGSWAALQTNWGLHLESVTNTRIERIGISGTANGIRLFGDGTEHLALSDLSVDLTGTNHAALSLEPSTTVISEVHVNGLQAVGDGDGTTGIYLKGGSSAVARCTFRNINLEWFDRLVTVTNGYANEFDLGYAEMVGTTGLTGILVDANCWGNLFNIADWYMPVSTVLINDQGTQNPRTPNRIGLANLFTEAGATASYLQNAAKTTLLQQVGDRGSGTSTSVKRSPLARAPHTVNNLGNSGTSTITLDGLQGSHWRITATGNFTLGNPVNLTDGQVIYLDVSQDATGGRLFNSVGSKFRFSATFPNATLTTTALKKDKLAWQYNAADDKLDLIHFIKGI